MQSLNLAVFVNLQYVNALEAHFSTLLAYSGSCPFHGSAVSRNEDLPLGQSNFLKGTGNRIKELTETLVTLDWWSPDRIVANRIHSESVDPCVCDPLRGALQSIL